MTKFQYGQWYQRGSEIFYIYDIDNFQERIWLAPAVHPKPYDASMPDFDIVQYEYFKDMHEYELVTPPSFNVDEVVMYVGPDVTYNGDDLLKHGSIIQIVNKYDEFSGKYYFINTNGPAIPVTPYEIKKSTISRFLFFYEFLKRRQTWKLKKTHGFYIITNFILLNLQMNKFAKFWIHRVMKPFYI